MRSNPISNLKPADSTDPLPCKICDGQSFLYGVVDFNRACLTPQAKMPTLSGVPVYYRLCSACGFIFSNCFDSWTQQEFNQYIYNDQYIDVDPDYAEVRPRHNARIVEQIFGKDKSKLSILDYGGGNGICGELLREAGFHAVEIYDPFTPKYARRPEGKFDIVICFETLEHLPNPLEEIKSIVESAQETGVVLFSTLVQPVDIEKYGMNWWYIGPRNGHVSIFSRNSLTLAWQKSGFNLASFSDDLHLAFRQIPDFAMHLMKSNR